jgi:C-terminal processing protease CtpA/Prc
VGGATARANGNVNPFRVPGGYAIQWTGLQTLKRDGSRLQGIGIVPTVPVKVTVADIRAGRDAALEKAIKIAEAR